MVTIGCHMREEVASLSMTIIEPVIRRRDVENQVDETSG